MPTLANSTHPGCSAKGVRSRPLASNQTAAPTDSTASAVVATSSLASSVSAASRITTG